MRHMIGEGKETFQHIPLFTDTLPPIVYIAMPLWNVSNVRICKYKINVIFQKEICLQNLFHRVFNFYEKP